MSRPSDDKSSAKNEDKWKFDALSSSVPLEFQVGRTLAEHGYYVNPDYAFVRNEGGTDKELSVDIVATRRIRQDLFGGVTMIVAECKYRRPSVSWLFWPDVNQSVTLGKMLRQLVRTVDYFSFPNRDNDALRDLAVPICYKGIEIDPMASERARDVGIKHGLDQLQFGMVQALWDTFALTVRNLRATRPLSGPTYLVPILVTTAPLVVARASLSDAEILAPGDVEGLGSRVEALSIEFLPGPLLRREVRRAFQETPDGTLAALHGLDQTIGSEEPNWTNRNLRYLQDGDEYLVYQYFSRFLVCNASFFGKIVGMVDELANERFESYLHRFRGNTTK